MSSRIVITGIGVVSPYGIGTSLLWEQLMAGKSALRPLLSFSTEHIHCRAGGQWTDFQPTDYMPARLARRIDRFSMFGLIAAEQAFMDAGFPCDSLLQADDAQKQRAERTGITVGNNLGGWEFAERELGNLWQKGPREISPYMATAWFPAAVQGIISIQLGLKGIGRTFVGDRASGAYAIKHAAQCLQAHHTDSMFAGGAEAPFSPYAALCYETSGLMSRQASERPEEAYRPFDHEHDGLVAGEGAAFLFMEREEDAVQRGAHIYAELAGWATTHDGYDQTQPAPDGKRFADAMRKAMKQAGVSAEQVDCVFAAGSAIPSEDASEAQAIRLALGEHVSRVPVCVPKSAFGNLFGAATPVDVVISLLTIQHRILPATLHLDQPAPDCYLEYVTKHPRPVSRLNVVAVNARGIGGANACLILRRWPEESTGDTGTQTTFITTTEATKN